MAREEPEVLVAIMQMVLQMAGSLGLRRTDLLREIDVQEADIADRDAYIALSKQVQLGELIARLRPGVNLGLVALDYMVPSTLGALGYVVSHSSTIGDGVEAFVRYQNLLSPAVRWSIERNGGARICIDADDSLQALGFPLETQVGVWIVLGRKLANARWSPERIQLRHNCLGPSEEFAERFGCSVEFGAPRNALDLSADVLALPVVGARPQLQPSLRDLIHTLQDRRIEPEPAEHSARVMALLFDELPRGMTSKDAAARSLGVSPRTLTRRLQAEGASFRELLERVRRQLAQAWLGDREVAIHEVAYLLGYSEPSTFHRSFRRWTGQTPAMWRRAHHPE